MEGCRVVRCQGKGCILIFARCAGTQGICFCRPPLRRSITGRGTPHACAFLALLSLSACLQDAGAGAARASSSAFGAAHAMFAARVTKGVGGGGAGESAEAGLWTKHQGAITCVQAMARNAKGSVTKFSTSGLDGRVIIWDLTALKHLPAAALGL